VHQLIGFSTDEILRVGGKGLAKRKKFKSKLVKFYPDEPGSHESPAADKQKLNQSELPLDDICLHDGQTEIVTRATPKSRQ